MPQELDDYIAKLDGTFVASVEPPKPVEPVVAAVEPPKATEPVVEPPKPVEPVVAAVEPPKATEPPATPDLNLLTQIASKFGVENVTSVEELVQTVTRQTEIQEQIQLNQRYNQLQQINAMTDEDVLRMKLKSLAIQNYWDEDEIEEKITKAIADETLPNKAGNIREEYSKEIKSIEEKVAAEVAEEQRKEEAARLQVISNITNGLEYGGIKIEPEDAARLKLFYESGEFRSKLTTENVAKMVLLLHPEISKKYMDKLLSQSSKVGESTALAGLANTQLKVGNFGEEADKSKKTGLSMDAYLEQLNK